MTRNRIMLVREMVKKCELPQYEVERVLDALGEAVGEFLINGDTVLLHPLGKFEVYVIKSRKARNPSTGVTFQAPSRRKARFKYNGSLQLKIKANRRGLDDEATGM